METATAPSTPPSTPPATRLTGPGWRDPRLWVGAALVAGSVVAGARLMASADDAAPVWVARRDLAAGTRLRPGDLARHRVRFADGADRRRYLSGSAEPGGELLRGVDAGELVPRAVVGPAGASGTVQLPLPVDPEQVPPSVGPGSVVDVYVLAGGGQGAGTSTGPALTGVPVLDVAEDDGLVVSGRRQLVLAVAEADARRFLGLLGGPDAPALTVVRRS